MALEINSRPFLIFLAGSRGVGDDSSCSSRTDVGISLFVTATYRIVDPKTGQIRNDFTFVDAVSWNFGFSTSIPCQKKQN